MGCQREIAGRIVEKKADYVLAVKDNQGLLSEQVKDSFLLLESDAVDEEIDSRKRAGHAAQNFSILNRIALNLLKQDKSSKRGIKGKRLKAAWDQVRASSRKLAGGGGGPMMFSFHHRPSLT